MYVIKKLRLNRFKAVPVQSPRRLYQLFGESKPAGDSSMTAKDIDKTIPYGAKKTQLIELGERVAQKAVEMVENPNAKPLDFEQPRNL